MVRSDSDEDPVRGAIGVIDEEEDDEDEDDEADDDILEMRSTRSTASSTRTLRAARPPMATKKPPRSQSVSTASSSSSASTSTSTTSATSATTAPSSSSSRSPARRASARTRKGSPPPAPGAHDPDSLVQRRRRPTLGARRTVSAQHVTIAPIAPTLLKTGGAWAEGFGDEGASDDGFAGLGLGGLYSAAYGLGGGSGSYTAAMDRAWAWNEGRARPSRGGSGETRSVGGRGEEEASDGTPVELVYAPPHGSGYARTHTSCPS